MRSWLDRRQCLAAGMAAAFGAARVSAAETVDGRWHDAARSRELPWRLRLPTDGAAWPLLLYSHGLGGNREGGEVWSRAWAGAGMAVLHLQHPGSDSEALRPISPAAVAAAASAEQLLARVLDVRFVLDQIERLARADAEPWRRLRLDAMGLAGHSFGALTTQAVAGQRHAVHFDGADARPRAFVALSPSAPRASGLGLKQAFGAITRPFMLITGTHDGDPFGSYSSGEPRAGVYDGLPEGRRALLWLEGADHMSFAGTAQQGLLARWRRPGAAQALQDAHHRIVAQQTLLWWRAHLLGDAEALQALARPQGLAPGDRFVLG